MSEVAPKPKRARWTVRLVLLGASLLLSCLLAEGAYRLLGPRPFKDSELGYQDGTRASLSEIIKTLRERAKQRGELGEGPRGSLSRGRIRQWYDRPEGDWFAADGSIEITVNSLGFRDEEFPVAKPAGEFRVLCLGDSFTFGPGVLNRDTWVEQLEEMLAADRGQPVQAINVGFAANGAYYTGGGYAEWLASDGLRFAPDLVIVGFCLNDMHKAVPMLGYAVPPQQPWLGGISALLNGIQQQLAIREAKAYDFSPHITALVTEDPGMWQESRAALQRMQALCAEQQVRLLVAILPMISKLGDDYPYLALHEMVRGACVELKIDHVDLLPQFRNREAERLWVHPTDQHPNPEGHRLIAAGIREHLRAQ